MSQEFHQRVREVFDAVFELPAADREAALRARCGDDTGLRAEVEEMLRYHEQSGAFLATPALGEGFELRRLPAAHADRLVGQHIGDFTLRRVIGSGGMGTVYEAGQEHPQRTVAIKVLRRGLAGRSALRRFEYEAQILARLNHPNIAQVIEAGTWQEEPDAPGLPYFVMEFIPGARTLTQYANQEHLDTEARLALFIDVCQAVHHAHQKGVIHRDLKPENILVDDQGRPKVIDFGVARVSDAEVALTTMHTGVDQILGTLQYMSPEQCDADPHDVDTRSDVYSLGIVLHELLSGALPYDVSRLAMHQALEVIRTREPVRSKDTRRVLRGDLETITTKALQKERNHRYGSVADLGADLRRYLDHEPIAARPPSALYQLTKFARRHRALVAGAIAVVVTLVLGLVGTTWQARVAGREAAVRETTIDFLREMLMGFEPGEGDMSVREMLDRAAAKVQGRFPDQPQVEGAVEFMLHTMYRQFGATGRAVEHGRRSVALLRRARGAEEEGTVTALESLAWVLDGEEAVRLAEEVWDGRRRAQGEDHLHSLEAANLLAMKRHEVGDSEEAEELLRRVLGVLDRVPGSDPLRGIVCNNIAVIRGDQGDDSGRLEWIDQAIAVTRSLDPPQPVQLANHLYNRGLVLDRFERPAEAAAAYAEALELRCVHLGEDNQASRNALQLLTGALEMQGKHEDAAQAYETFLARHRERYPASFPKLGLLLHHYAVTLRCLGRLEDAARVGVEALDAYHYSGAGPPGEILHAVHVVYRPLIETALEVPRIALLERAVADIEHLDPECHERVEMFAILGPELVFSKRYQRGTDLLLEYFDRLADDPDIPRTPFETQVLLHQALGRGLTAFQLYDDAEPELLAAVDLLDVAPKQPGMKESVYADLVRFYEAWGKPDEAAKWRNP